MLIPNFNRTIDEAWAIFLEYEKDMGGVHAKPGTQQIYHSMFEKVFHEERRRSFRDTGKRSHEATPEDMIPLPGDGKEVFENPPPGEGVSVPRSPPSIDEFYDMLLKAKIRPSPRFLALLLTHAPSFRAGVQYMELSELPAGVVKGLLLGGSDPGPCVNVGDHLSAAIIHFLCRFAPRFGQKRLPLVKLTDTHSVVSKTSRINPLEQAFRLTFSHAPFYRPPWNSLLAALARKRIRVETVGPKVDYRIQDILAWNLIRSTVREMESRHLGIMRLDPAGFRSVCIGYEKTITASAELVDVPNLKSLHPTLHGNVKRILESGLSFIKRNFATIVSGESRSFKGDMEHGLYAIKNLVPRLLEVPVPAQLHPFIRILGLRGDHEGIIDLLEWMSYYAHEIQAAADEVMNGERMLRRCLTAARVFLEQSPSAIDQLVPDGAVSESGASKEGTKASSGKVGVPPILWRKDRTPETFIQRFRRIVDENPAWGGWPTDEEVGIYDNRP